MDSETADLGCYIAKCRYSQYGYPTDRIFDVGITHRRPLLQRNRINRILLYPGCFNPPHNGHLALLTRAFATGQDVNIVAAIILPLDDDAVNAKCRALGSGLVFTKEERVRLWRGYVPHDWYWIYDQDLRQWSSFRRLLTDIITQDGFDIDFAVLAGPDHIKQGSLPCTPWDCDEIIVSDVGRAADFVTTSSILQLKDCETWEPVIWPDEAVAHYSKTVAAFLCGGMSLLAPATLKQELDNG
jgi:cytidyltransferase-like protein